MDKWTPHYKLTDIQEAVAERGEDAFTATALQNGRAMGLELTDMLAVIASLTRKQFYKSMTTHRDHRTWQDVYHAPTPCGEAYVKCTLRAEGAVVVSFKRLEES